MSTAFRTSAQTPGWLVRRHQAEPLRPFQTSTQALAEKKWVLRARRNLRDRLPCLRSAEHRSVQTCCLLIGKNECRSFSKSVRGGTGNGGPLFACAGLARGPANRRMKIADIRFA